MTKGVLVNDAEAVILKSNVENAWQKYYQTDRKEDKRKTVEKRKLRLKTQEALIVKSIYNQNCLRLMGID